MIGRELLIVVHPFEWAVKLNKMAKVTALTLNKISRFFKLFFNNFSV